MAEPAFPDTTAASLSSLSTSQQKYSNSSGNNECAASTPSDWSRARQVQRQASKTLMVFLIHDLPLPSVQKDYLTLLQYCLQTWICGFSDHERLHFEKRQIVWPIPADQSLGRWLRIYCHSSKIHHYSSDLWRYPTIYLLSSSWAIYNCRQSHHNEIGHNEFFYGSPT